MWEVRKMHLSMDGRAHVCSCKIRTSAIRGGRIRTMHMYRQKIAPCIFRTSHVRVGRMYGSRVTHGAVTEKQLSRSNFSAGNNMIKEEVL